MLIGQFIYYPWGERNIYVSGLSIQIRENTLTNIYNSIKGHKELTELAGRIPEYPDLFVNSSVPVE